MHLTHQILQLDESFIHQPIVQHRARKVQSVWTPREQQSLSCVHKYISHPLLRMVPSAISALHFQETHVDPTIKKCSSFSFSMFETEKHLRICVEISLVQGRCSLVNVFTKDLFFLAIQVIHVHP